MSFLKENKRQNKLRTDLLKFSVSKDETRLHLNAVWHDDKLGALVSTNGHHATILRSRYCPKLVDILIDPNTFQVIERDAVNISQVIPSKFKEILTYTIEKHHYVSCSGRKKPTHCHFYNDGTITVADIDNSKTKLFTVNASFLKYLVGGTYKVGFHAELSPVAFDLSLERDNLNFQGDIYIVMPLNV